MGTIETLENKIKEEFENLKRTIKKPNVLILGGTGVGKSSLVNLCFGKDLAEVGVGKPVTQHMIGYEDPGSPIKLFDTKGYQVGTPYEEECLNNVVSYANENTVTQDEKIHLIWYCISAPSARITDFDVEIILKLKGLGIPISVVFTKCDIASEADIGEMNEVLLNSIPDISQFELTTDKTLKCSDLSNLISWSIDELPQGLKFSFNCAQIVNLSAKWDEAKKIVIEHASGAAFVGFAPIPFSDAPILIANQLALLARILFLYDLQSIAPTIQNTIGTIGLPVIISSSGVWLVGQILKIIPGIGTFGGGLISATVASTITAIIGFSVVQLCDKIFRTILEGSSEDVKNIFENIDNIFENIVKANSEKGKSELFSENDNSI